LEQNGSCFPAFLIHFLIPHSTEPEIIFGKRSKSREKTMRVVVTCGPSYEPIDEVRRITNFSTGELGALLANQLVKAGCEVMCFRGVGATSQERIVGAKVVPFATNQHLQSALEELPERETVGAVFHAAALVDYRVKSVLTSSGTALAATKIPSSAGDLTITLGPYNKLIHGLRALFPKSRIVGWKYELVGSRADVLAAAIRQLAESRTDACVMNGAAYGSGFGFLEPKLKPLHLADKPTLCQHLAQWVKGKKL
jgi:phosphopantothenoylcysteine synthetase/decarboxylase